MAARVATHDAYDAFDGLLRVLVGTAVTVAVVIDQDLDPPATRRGAAGCRGKFVTTNNLSINGHALSKRALGQRFHLDGR